MIFDGFLYIWEKRKIKKLYKSSRTLSFFRGDVSENFFLPLLEGAAAAAVAVAVASVGLNRKMTGQSVA